MTTIARLAAALAAWSALGVAGTAAAQPVYRCGNAYSTEPCPGGRTVEMVGGPSARDRAAAEQAAVAQRREAAAMTAARERREAAPRPAPANVGPAVAAAPSASAVANLKPPRKAKGRIRVVGAEDFTVRTAPPGKPPKPGRSQPAP